MPFTQQIAALDIGQTATKLVVAEKSGRTCKVIKSAIFRNRNEGLMDQVELSEHLSTWLTEQGASELEYVVGLPQYMAMTQISDFPPVSGGKLEEMVGHETQQLGGLTDEVFVHDHQCLAPFHHYENPVLIAVCREALLRSRLELFEPADLKLDKLYMEGHALVAAFLSTQSQADSREGLKLLLDVGAENTTMVLLLDGQVLHMNSFLFGGDFFNEALTRHLGTSQIEAEKAKMTSKLVPGETQSPLTRSGQNFVMELEGALENWRSHDPDAIKLQIDEIYLSGGGACLEGFDEFLSKTYSCKAAYIQTPQFDDLDQDAREFNIAFGLAVQALDLGITGSAPNLLPADLQWIARRRKRVPYLYAALLLLVLLLAGFLGLTFWSVEKERMLLEKETSRLDRCQPEVNGLEFARTRIDSYQLKLRPFAARGNRNEKFIASVYSLSKAKQRGDWVYLVADYPYGYEERNPMAGVEKKTVKNGEWFRPSNGNEGMAATISLTTNMVEPWDSLVVSGFTPKQMALRNVKRMIEQLNKSALFSGVDSNPDQNTSALDSLSRRPWLIFRMRPFSLICPFEQTEFSADDREAPTP